MLGKTMKLAFALCAISTSACASALPEENLLEERATALVQSVSPGVAYIPNYAAVLPYPFFRAPVDGESTPTYGTLQVNDPSWKLVNSSSFILFDKQRGQQILGPNASVTFQFSFPNPMSFHEAPVFVPSANKLFFSELQDTSSTFQYVIDLSKSPPTLSKVTASPPIYAPNGGFFHNGLIYYAASGSNKTSQRPGIITYDPTTNKATTLLNNYYGLAFSGSDDIIVDSTTGYIWFTSPYYSWFLGLSDLGPELRSGTFRFDPATGSTVNVDDTMFLPNGIAMSPDRQHLYISDTAAAGLTDSIDIDSPPPTLAQLKFNATGKRTVYKYEFTDGNRGIINKRPIYYDAIGSIPDGLKVASNGYVVTAAGNGLTVMDEYGAVIARVQTNFTVNNFQWTSANNYTDVWMVGQGGVAHLKWALQGQTPS